MSLKIWLPLNGSFEEKVQHKMLEEPNACTLPSVTTSGKIGIGYRFGDREAIKIPYINIPSTVSYALWVRLDGDCARHILDCRLGNQGTQPLYYDPQEGIQIYSSAGGPENNYIPFTFELGKWYHLVVIMTDGLSELYINGVKMGQIEGNVGISGDYDIHLGCRYTGENLLNGSIQDFRMYDHALSQLEIKELAKGLALHLKFNTGTIQIDDSGYERHAESPNGLGAGELGMLGRKSGAFNGNQYVRCGRDILLSDEVTVSGWFYSNGWDYVNSSQNRLASCAQNGGWDFWPNSQGYMTMEVYRNGKYITGVFPTLLSGPGWYHIVGTYDGYKAEIYINGIKGITSEVTTTKYPITYHPSNSLFIGAEAGESASTPDGLYFTGAMSDFRIYATALSEEDVQVLYNTNAMISNVGDFAAKEFIETTDNMFNEAVFTSVVPNTGGNGTIENRKGSLAYGLQANVFWVSSNIDSANILKGKFDAGAQYQFDLWMDVDGLTSNGDNVPGGFVIVYTDGTLDYALNAQSINSTSGWQHITYTSQAGKTIAGLTVRYWVGNRWYLRTDSTLFKVTNESVKIGDAYSTRAAQFNEVQFDENCMFDYNGRAISRQIIEI